MGLPEIHSNCVAIAAMSSNRVIGANNTIPWRLPEDFKWFKQTTLGHILVMGRKTFESIGRPLPGRETIVLSRSASAFPGVRVIHSADQLPLDDPRTLFICGGADIYRQLLPFCSELLLTHVDQTVDGDATFPFFEDLFEPVEIVRQTPEFKIIRYRNRKLEQPRKITV
ncbi:MAG: Dihydrofolate reductase [Verrucomicrobiales bacterium]|nr:Dihydrofolate reductase [Verrucomicrobiales bacterium]